MRQKFHAIANQFRAMPADFLAMPGVFVRKFLGGGEREELAFSHRFPGEHLATHIVHRVDRINGGGAGISQRLIDRLDVRGKLFQVAAAKGKCALGQTKGRRGPDGAGTTHHHVGDGARGLAKVFRADDFEFVRQ